MRELFLYAEKQPAALDASIVVYAVNRPALKQLNPKKLTVADLDRLEEEKQLFYLHEFIPVVILNRLGYKEGIKVKLENLIAQAIYELGGGIEAIYRTSNTPSSYYYPAPVMTFKEEPLFYIGRTIAEARKKWWCEHAWGVRLPQYDWANNLGRDTEDHIIRTLKYGFNPNYHYKSFRKRIVVTALRMVSQFDKRVVLDPEVSRSLYELIVHLEDTNNKENGVEMDLTSLDLKRLQALKHLIVKEYDKDLEKELYTHIPEHYAPFIRNQIQWHLFDSMSDFK